MLANILVTLFLRSAIHTPTKYIWRIMATFIFLWGGETGFMYLKSPVMQFPSVRLSLLFLRAEYKICTYYNIYIYIYIYPRFSIEQTWKIAKLRMRTEMEEQFYTTLFHFIITWCVCNTNKYNWRSLAHLCWKEHIPSSLGERSEPHTVLRCSIEISRDIYICVVCQINGVGGIT